ncbi:unnamed protein product, partial [marine sediment metagenome]
NVDYKHNFPLCKHQLKHKITLVKHYEEGKSRRIKIWKMI